MSPDNLSHSGVPGMKWGRRSGAKTSSKSTSKSQQTKKSGEEIAKAFKKRQMSLVTLSELKRGQSLLDKVRIQNSYQKKYEPQSWKIDTMRDNARLTVSIVRSIAAFMD